MQKYKSNTNLDWDALLNLLFVVPQAFALQLHSTKPIIRHTYLVFVYCVTVTCVMISRGFIKNMITCMDYA